MPKPKSIFRKCFGESESGSFRAKYLIENCDKFLDVRHGGNCKQHIRNAHNTVFEEINKNNCDIIFLY
jgi:hypothetical protein